MALKLKIFFWIGILFILTGIALHPRGLGFEIVDYDREKQHQLIGVTALPSLWCLILGVVDLIVVGILWRKLPTADMDGDGNNGNG